MAGKILIQGIPLVWTVVVVCHFKVSSWDDAQWSVVTEVLCVAGMQEDGRASLSVPQVP